MKREMPIERLALVPEPLFERQVPYAWKQLEQSIVLEAIATKIYQFRSDRNAWHQSRSTNSSYWHISYRDAHLDAQRKGMYNQGTSRDCVSREAVALRTNSCLIFLSKSYTGAVIEHKYTASCPPLAGCVLRCFERSKGLDLHLTLRGNVTTSGRSLLDPELDSVISTFEESIKRPFFGVVAGELEGSQGLFVLNVIPGSRAANAGIQPGDRIIRVNTWDGSSGQEHEDPVEVLRVLYDLNSSLSSITLRIDWDEVTVTAFAN